MLHKLCNKSTDADDMMNIQCTGVLKGDSLKLVLPGEFRQIFVAEVEVTGSCSKIYQILNIGTNIEFVIFVNFR